MLNSFKDRSRNIMDGGYVNAPNSHAPGRDIGLREFNSSVLVHNWFEERTPFEKKEHPKNTTYKLDYKPYPDAKPDVVLRKQMIRTSEGVGTRNLIGMHDFDSSKNMITLYDETINKRHRPEPEVPVGQKFPEKRSWKIISDAWIPEKIDYPLQDTPTNWGLAKSKSILIEREHDKYKKQLPEVSEYRERFQKHSTEAYLQRQQTGIPKNISSSLYDLNKTLNNTTKPRQTTSSIREPQARDVMDSVYENMFARSSRAPRTFYYLGKIPTNGALDVFNKKDFETLVPVNNLLTNTSAMMPPSETVQQQKPVNNCVASTLTNYKPDATDSTINTTATEKN